VQTRNGDTENMRVCTKCGHKDPLIWRNNPHRLYTQYCRLDELEDWESELAKLLKALWYPNTICDYGATIPQSNHVKIQGYIYHLNKAGIVCRIHESDSVDGISYREPRTEKRLKHRILIPHQTKLEVRV
jgi:hypothetical protein